MDKKTFYITTTLPYVNDKPHIGHALEFTRADVIARWKRLLGYEVMLNTGTDEHGQKILKAAKSVNFDPKAYADKYATHFKELCTQLGMISDLTFTRTTDAQHEHATQEFWKRVQENGYIYKKNYQTKYCVACEEAKTESELVNGRCALHQTLELELIAEENYFFKFSAFGDKLLALYDAGAFRVAPDFRMNEMREFVKRGLLDFSISRLKDKMPWGVPVPGDPAHVMYVWMDALPSYISALGWPEDAAKFDKFWKNGTPTQYCGKDNNRFQSVMWQAMLLAAGLPPTHTVVVDGFVTGEGGIKMSKSLGNVVDPIDVIRDYGTEAFRYFVCRELSSFEDSPFTVEMFKTAYNAALANGLGNLTSRVMKMAKDNLDGPVSIPEGTIPDDFRVAMESFNIQAACNIIWKHITEADQIIQIKAPFKLVKTDKQEGQQVIGDLCVRLYTIGRMLNPIMPETSKTIKDLVKTNSMPAAPLFLRK